MAISPLGSNMIGSSGFSYNFFNNRVASTPRSSAARDIQKTLASQRDQLQTTLSSLNSLLGKKDTYTPEAAQKAAAEGAATHGFFYHDIDALAKSAAGGEGKVDSSFARDTLDFFTGGSYTQADVDQLQQQMTTALEEMGSQVLETGSLDTGALKSKVEVGGVKMSLQDLAGFQTMGQQITPAFNAITSTSSRFDDMQATAKMAVARLAGQRYGQSRGEAGQMFANAINGLYNKGMDRIDQLYTGSSASLPTGYAQASNELRGQVSDLFSGIRTDNRSIMAYDFNRSMSGYTGMMNQQYQQLGTPMGGRTAGASAQQLGMYFSALSRFME